MVRQMVSSWNQIIAFLKEINIFRQVLGQTANLPLP